MITENQAVAFDPMVFNAVFAVTNDWVVDYCLRGDRPPSPSGKCSYSSPAQPASPHF
ncbi:MAG: hypothetical protein ACRC8Y_06880 [Chroococcales cyanobacterium]